MIRFSADENFPPLVSYFFAFIPPHIRNAYLATRFPRPPRRLWDGIIFLAIWSEYPSYQGIHLFLQYLWFELTLALAQQN